MVIKGDTLRQSFTVNTLKDNPPLNASNDKKHSLTVLNYSTGVRVLILKLSFRLISIC